jgi:peptidoglycan/LPS O-acetylase OafA/YrhL
VPGDPIDARTDHPDRGPSDPSGATPAMPATGRGPWLGQFDSYRVVACLAVVLQHSLLWTVQAGNVAPWTLVMLLHFSRTAFFFLTALVLTYSQVTRPRSTWGFWGHRYLQLGVPYVAWTTIYWAYTLVEVPGSRGAAGSVFGQDLLRGYYQLYFCVVLFQLYLVFPLLLRLLQRSRHHARVMAASGAFALLLAAVLHYPHAFGPVGAEAFRIAGVWPWARNLLTYQEQFIAGVLVAFHLDQVRRFTERWYRQVIAAAAAVGVVAALWYLVAVWTGSPTGRASDLYQPIAFLWFTAAVAALECGTWWWYRRTRTRTRTGHPPRWPALSARRLATLTGGVYLSHVLFINLMRSALQDSGIGPHLGWAGEVAALFTLTILSSAACTALVLTTPLRWVLGGPVRAEQRAAVDRVFPPEADDPTVDHGPPTSSGDPALGAPGLTVGAGR